MLKNKVKETRTDNDISQKLLAEMVGISRQALHAIENGRAIPSLEVAFKIAHALEVKIDRLFSWSEDKKRRDEIAGFTLFNHKFDDD